jgi:hypothetical protein
MCVIPCRFRAFVGPRLCVLWRVNTGLVHTEYLLQEQIPPFSACCRWNIRAKIALFLCFLLLILPYIMMSSDKFSKYRYNNLSEWSRCVLAFTWRNLLQFVIAEAKFLIPRSQKWLVSTVEMPNVYKPEAILKEISPHAQVVGSDTALLLIFYFRILKAQGIFLQTKILYWKSCQSVILILLITVG